MIYHNKELESELLGTILDDPDLLLELDIEPRDFYHAGHRQVFEACKKAYSEEGLFTIQNLVETSNGRITAGYLVGLQNAAVSKSAGKMLAKKLREKTLARELQKVGRELVEGEITEPQETVKKLEYKMIEMIRGSRAKKEPDISAVTNRLVESFEETEKQKQLGMRIGIPYLEKSVAAYIRGHLWILGGFTSSGKTSLMWEMIRQVYDHNDNPHVYVASAEMSDEANELKLVANYSNIPVLNIMQWYRHTDETRGKIMRCLGKIREYNLTISDNLITWSDIYMQAKKQKIQKGLDFLFVDFVQNLQGEGKIYDRMSELAPDMQNVAKELDCTVIAMSQLANADAATGEFLKFKGAGELAAACDIGILLKRGVDEKKNWTKEMAMILKKSRWGATGWGKMRFNDTFTRVIPDEELD